MPPLSCRVNLGEYSAKLFLRAKRFEAWSSGSLVALLAAYFNDLEKHVVYITSVSVLKEWMGKGLAAQLLGQCIEYARGCGMRQIRLHVASSNLPAVSLYEKAGFVAEKAEPPFIYMNLYLPPE